MKKIVYLLMAIMLTASVSFAQSKKSIETIKENFVYPVLIKQNEVYQIGFVNEYTKNDLEQSKHLMSGVIYQYNHPNDASLFEHFISNVSLVDKQLEDYCFVYIPKSNNQTPIMNKRNLTLLDFSYDNALKLIN